LRSNDAATATHVHSHSRNYAAGILPITFYRDQALFLVGKDVRDGTFSDFGGKVERFDRGDPMTTACREFYEETLGTVLGIKPIRARLNEETSILIMGRTQNQNAYYMYVTEVPYDPHLRNTFAKLTAFLRSKNVQRQLIEKTDLQWATLDMLKRIDKRGVFSNTLDRNVEIIEEIGTCRAAQWRALCARQTEARDA
jgi:8-oxo-dGTP pyrophosphatase MutT (NUDIX family)